MTDTTTDTLHWLVVTDLDGTLLDHHSYDWQPAKPALRRLSDLHIPLILNSSKTSAEMQALREAMQHTDPYIAENGAVVTLPTGYFQAGDPEQCITLSTDRNTLLETLERARQAGFRFQSFHAMSAAELADVTGLTTQQAELAKQRCATEPLIWQGTTLEREDFQRYLNKHGLQLQAGGRFWHVMSPFDKADAMRYLVRRFQRERGGQWHTIALGDGPNDQDMLASADIAVVIPGARSAELALTDHPCCHYASQPGPTGWNATLQTILDQITTQHQATTDCQGPGNNIRPFPR